MKLYYKSRYNYFNKNEWRYTLEYLYKLQRPDYDFVFFQYIPDNKYTNGNNICLNGNEKHLVVVDVDLTNTTKTIEDIKYDFDNFYKWLFNLAELTKEQAKEFIDNNTNLISTWWEVQNDLGIYKFEYLIQEANEQFWTEAIYLVIE